MSAQWLYDVLMIDPPWPNRKGGRRLVRPNQGRTLDYKTMDVTQLFAFMDSEIFTMAAQQHTVFLWTVDRFLHTAERAMESRGYKLHARMIWDKGNGIAPSFTLRYCHEYLLWFYKPKLTPVAIEMRGKFKTVFSEKPREHSRKPDVAYATVSLLYPKAYKIDVFSRESRWGWDQYGDEKEKFSGKGSIPR